MKILWVAAAAVFLTACGTTRVGMQYAPTSQTARVAPSSPPVVVGSFLDQRGEDSNWLGVIRGGFGNHLKTMESDKPVAELVRGAFFDALKNKGVDVSSKDAPFQISGRVNKLYADQVVRREATVDIDVSVFDKDGNLRITRNYKANKVDGSMLSLSTGVLASVEDLRAVLEAALREAVDSAMNDTALMAALKQQPI